MGKGNTTSSKEMIQKNWEDTLKNQEAAHNRFDTNFGAAQDRANTAYNDANSNFSGASGGYRSVLDKFDLSKPGTLESRYGSENARKYGTWDPERVAGVDKSIGTIDAVGDRYHGYADEYNKFAKGKSAQGKYYSDLLDTGGFSEGDKADFRGRVNSVVPSLYDSYKSENDRLRAIQGGINPGYTGQTAKLARDAADASQSAVQAGEVDLANQIRAGKLAGGEHLDSDFLSGMTGALNATGGELNARSDATNARDTLGNQLAQSSADLSKSMLDEDKMRGDMVLQGSAGLTDVGKGLTSLRSSVPGETNMWLDNLLNSDKVYGDQRDVATGQKNTSEQNKWNLLKSLAGAAGSAIPSFLPPQQQQQSSSPTSSPTSSPSNQPSNNTGQGNRSGNNVPNPSETPTSSPYYDDTDPGNPWYTNPQDPSQIDTGPQDPMGPGDIGTGGDEPPLDLPDYPGASSSNNSIYSSNRMLANRPAPAPVTTSDLAMQTRRRPSLFQMRG